MKDLKNIKDKKVLQKVKVVIENVKIATKPAAVNHLKKLRSYETFYRTRIGDYRIGIEIINEEAIFARFLHRKEMYRFFP